ncbi:MAG: transposase [Armatimonadota bacterium]|nr:transposase [Armatimonadota bacterium]
MERSIDQPARGDPSTSPRPEIAFLLLDGLRSPGAPGGGVTVLCALGLDRDGRAHPLAWRAVPGEHDREWLAVLRDLKAGGVGRHLLLVCCDGHPALLRTIPEVYPGIPIQISVAHRLLALSRMVDRRWRAACLAEARAIFSAPDLAAAVGRFREWRARWAVQAHRAVASLESDLAACLTFYRFSPLLWPKVRTVNLVERAFREVRRTVRLPEAGQSLVQSPTASQEPAPPEPPRLEPVPPQPVQPEPAGVRPVPPRAEPVLPAPSEVAMLPPPPAPAFAFDAGLARRSALGRRRGDGRTWLLAAAALAVLAGLAAGLALAWSR